MENKEKFIKKVFNNIADDYDFMNLILTGGLFSFWQNELLKEMQISNEEKILDVCCGSGKLTAKVAKKLNKDKGGHISGVDFSEKMLQIARERRDIKKLPVDFFCQDALHLQYEDKTFDKAFNSFALRNLSSIDEAFQEMYRVTKEGASIYILEVSKPENKLIRFFFGIYYYKVVPIIGRISDKGKKIEGRYSPYQWLSESLKNFPETKEIISKFYEAGFKEVTLKSYGLGGISLFCAKK